MWCGVVVCGPPGSSRSVSVSALTLTASKAGSHLVVLELLLELLLVLQMDGLEERVGSTECPVNMAEISILKRCNC